MKISDIKIQENFKAATPSDKNFKSVESTLRSMGLLIGRLW